jgi:predicted RNase H-like HicB family nuclease
MTLRGKKTIVYIGILDGSENVWGIRIPDFPGCFSGGETAEEAIKEIFSAALEWIERTKSRGKKIPAPNSKSDILQRDKLEVDEFIVFIPFVVNGGDIEINVDT